MDSRNHVIYMRKGKTPTTSVSTHKRCMNKIVVLSCISQRLGANQDTCTWPKTKKRTRLVPTCLHNEYDLATVMGCVLSTINSMTDRKGPYHDITPRCNTTRVMHRIV